MRLRLIKKLAQKIDGVDLSAHDLGDILNLSRSEARLLIAEGWAVREPKPSQRRKRHANADVGPAVTADRPKPRRT